MQAASPAPADAELEASVPDWESMLNGRTDPEALFVQGRLTIHGDMDLATRLLQALAYGELSDPDADTIAEATLTTAPLPPPRRRP